MRSETKFSSIHKNFIGGNIMPNDPSAGQKLQTKITALRSKAGYRPSVPVGRVRVGF